jgi:catechol 2,3-dioxygenase-like lactoylglutathione lyase family enzyme
MRIVVTSVFVDDQSKALAFYTDVLGFRKKADIPCVTAAAVLVAALLATVVPTPSALAQGVHPGEVLPTTPRATDPTAFVHRLVGEWSVVTHTVLGPGQEPVRSEGRETARMVGSWLVSESVGEAGGRSFTAILTLGWDPHRDRFVATWIDGVQRHMWQYTGALDGAGAVLTLETEGPFMGDASRTARYRVLIEAPAPDRKVMRSEILGPDGEWFEFSRAEYQRLE